MEHALARSVPVRLRQAGARILRGRPSPPPPTACHAPAVQLYLQPDGDVRACCRNWTHPLGNVGRERLIDIWKGSPRQELRGRLAVDDYSAGCQSCEWEISVEGRESSYAETFLNKAHHLTAKRASGAWPRFMEFNLSNSCNLQCIQCNGELSSSIRIHREGRPPMAKVYGDEFFEDLALFLPHLTEAQFAGGEPFMAAENFRAWEMIAELAPHIVCQVVTNATQWNKRVERAFEMLPLGFTFSIDGITRETYEAIRIDSDFDQVMANVERYCAYANRVGTELWLNFCLMTQNYHEFGALLIFAEERGITVNVSVVHYPEHCSIARLDPAEIARVHRELLAQSDDVVAKLVRNQDVWLTEVARIGSWAGRDEAVDAAANPMWGFDSGAAPLPTRDDTNSP